MVNLHMIAISRELQEILLWGMLEFIPGMWLFMEVRQPVLQEERYGVRLVQAAQRLEQVMKNGLELLNGIDILQVQEIQW